MVRVRSTHLAITLASVTIPLLSSAQLWRQGPSRHTPRAMDAQVFTAGRVLPAGVFFGGNRYEIELARWPAPSGFLVVRNIRNADDATAAVRSLSARGLAPGYPWVIERRLIGLMGEGPAVVVGTFATSDDATGYRARFADLALDYAPRDAALEATARLHDSSRTEGNVRIVTQVVGSHAVHAYSIEDVAHIDASFTGDVETEPRHSYDVRSRNESIRRTAAATPVCDVQPNTVFDFTVTRREHASSRSWSAVRCGERLAYVPRDVTNTEAVVWMHRDGRARVTQVTLVECDCAAQTTWILEAGERVGAEHAMCRGC